MNTDNFKYLETKQPSAVWKYVAWTLYVLFGLVSTAVVIIFSENHFVILIWIAMVVFGPKLWKH